MRGPEADTADLERFNAFIDDEGYGTGAWRGSINEGADVRTPRAEDAAGSWSSMTEGGVFRTI